MTEHNNSPVARRPWIAPEIVELDVSAAKAAPNRGADAGGNPTIDCQKS